MRVTERLQSKICNLQSEIPHPRLEAASAQPAGANRAWFAFACFLASTPGRG